MKKALLVFFCSLFLGELIAQSTRWTISGQVLDESKKPLSSATITLLDPKDSTLVTFGVSNPSGAFEIKNLKESEILLQISFVGFRSYFQTISRPLDAGTFQLGEITMEENLSELDAVTVESIAPVTIKKDTIEYNSAAFKVQPNASVEDLLKRFPGMEIDSDGNIRAQGERVRRVLVNGKEFFGTDPKLATKNLLAEAVDKIQLFDRRSDQSQFTGIDDGQREKTINIQLKESFSKGFFGNVNAGVGADERYGLRANINKFGQKQQFSLLGMSNNTNEQGFSIEDYINFSGGVQSFASGGQVRINVGGPGAASSIPLNTGQRVNGIMQTHALGANLSQEFNKKTKLNSSYFFNQVDHRLTQDTERLNFLPNGDIAFTEKSRQDNQNGNHRLNLVIDHKIDTLNSLRSTSDGNFTTVDRVSNSITQNRDGNGNLINQGERSNLTTGETLVANTEFLFRHRFQKPGRTWSANFRGGMNNSNFEGILNATNEFFGSFSKKEVLDQRNLQDNQSANYGVNISYSEPLGGRKYLELVYNFRQNHNKVNREVFDVEDGVLVFNQNLSNRFRSLYTFHRPGANFSYNAGKSNIVAGIAYQATSLNGELLLFDEKIQTDFQNLLPSLRFNHSFGNNKNLGVNYSTSVNEPSIEQLQPVINNADPLNIFVGNPELRPAYIHSWRINYTSFDIGRMFNFFGNAFVNYTQNAIVNSQTIDERGVRVITPVNVSSNLTANGSMNVGFPIKKLNGRVNFGPNLSYSQGLNLINGTEDEIRISNLGGNVRYDYQWKEWVNIGLSANTSRQETGYAFNPQQNQLFYNQSYSAEANINFLKQYMLGGNFNYLYFKNRTTGFEQSLPILNVYLSRFVMKNKKGEIRISGQNLLNQQVGVSQRADVNFIEQTVTNNLGRIVMVSFTYKLNNHLNQLGNMARPGGARMIRFNN